MCKRRESQYFQGFDAWGRLGHGFVVASPVQTFRPVGWGGGSCEPVFDAWFLNRFIW